MPSAAIEVVRVPLAAPAAPGCADAAVRAILTERLGAPPDVVRGPDGKPGLASGALAFSVAHAGRLALVAISEVGPIGVDLEERRPHADPDRFARRFFSAAEAARVAADPRELLRVWCRKEALLKARGTGLRFPLAAVDALAPPPGWLLADLDVGAGYVAALASADPSAVIRISDRA